MSKEYVAERAIHSPGHSAGHGSGERVSWVVADTVEFSLHLQACAFVAGLRSRGLSVNTERVYAGRVALYLTWCAESAVVWSAPGLRGLSRFQDWLVNEPLPARSPRRAGVARFRSRSSANAVLTVVGEFLRFGAVHGWVEAATVAMLAAPRARRMLPPGTDLGERAQFGQVAAARFRFKSTEDACEVLTSGQVRRLVELTGHARDRFLVLVLVVTGMRIGEALGLRREDMHLLATSRALGCSVSGPHVHVRRRANSNGALAKSRYPRWIPVTIELVEAYTDYLYERDQADVTTDAAPDAADGCEMVFVNLFRAPVGRAMNYDNAKELFERLSRTAGFPARPHMLRHSAATGWLRAGVSRDVVQHLLGHVSASSLQPYIHIDERDTRAAVEAAWHTGATSVAISGTVSAATEGPRR